MNPREGAWRLKNLHAVLVPMLAAVTIAATAHAQGVGINATGAAADTSAILDLAATNKGFLPPRMTQVQRTTIALPATGLLVYQTDGSAGLYYNTGTPAAPNWRLVGDAANTGPWSLNGSSAYYNGGNVGIGTSTPAYPLNVVSGVNGLRVQTNTSGGAALSVGGLGTVGVDAPGVANGRLSLLENGNLGLGVATPTNRLSFAPVLGKKISLYPGATGDVGFGVAGNRLQIYADNPNADVALGYDQAGTFIERFAVKPTGALAVNGNAGAAGQVLQSNGPSSAATWVSPTNAAYQNTYFVESSVLTTVTAGAAPVDLPGMSINFTIPGNAKLVANASAYVVGLGCTSCSTSMPELQILVDGSVVHSSVAELGQGETTTMTGAAYRTRTAGAHTVSLRGYAQLQNARFGLANGTMSTKLIVQVIPE